MEDSTHIYPPLTSPDIYAFATGYCSGSTVGPFQIAWELENAALDLGWPIEHSLGSEADLVDRYESNHDVVRGAICLLEARGLMRMRRGREGGLRLLRPEIDHAAAAFTIFLLASGYSRADLEVTVPIVSSLLGEWRNGALVRDLWNRILAMSSRELPARVIESARAEIVATQLLRQLDRSIPATGVPLGCEAELCEKFGLGHRTFRQVVCILDDLGMLEVKRGRGGGYWLKRPTVIGIVRRLFALLASRGTTAEEVESVFWALGLANLRLVFLRLKGIEPCSRAALCDGLSLALHGLTGMRRWVIFQKELSKIADDLLLSTTISSLLAYLGRLGSPDTRHGPFDPRLLDCERGILQAMRDGADADAERNFLMAQAYMPNNHNDSRFNIM